MSFSNPKYWLRMQLFLGTCAALSIVASAQRQQTPAPHSLEVAAGYTYLHSNAPAPGGCGCFALQGGNVSVELHLRSGLSFAGQFEGTHASDILGSTQNLTLMTYQVGVRLRLRRLQARHLSLFGEALGGAAHTSSNLAFNNGNTGLSVQLGGGVDVPLNEHMSLRPAQADYLSTHIANNAGNFQNNFRFSSGIVFRFR